MQSGSTTAIGSSGGSLGYGSQNGTGLPNSIAIKFDIYSNNGEGADSTGLYVNGAAPTTPAIDMTSSGVNLRSGDVFNVQMSYDGTNLTMSITDATTNATFTHTWAVNVTGTVGGSNAYVGFTGGTGGYTAIQDIIGWTLTSSASGTSRSHANLQPGGRYLFDCAKRDHQRHHQRRHDLLHNQRHHADDVVDEVHRTHHGEQHADDSRRLQ